MTKEQGLEIIKKLVDRFNEQLPFYKKIDYNETQTRIDFIDPFFKALGWDIDNEQGYAESYREVIHEDKVKVANATKAPDYSFRIGGIRKFFVEAKKPSIFIKDDILPAFQVRRYGWSAKLSVSVITDFEEFAIYDCTKKPILNDSASVARVKYFTFNDYVNEWDFLWNTFSKEAINKGSFDKFIKGNENKRGTETVNKAFLQSLDEWRTLLAETISKENKQLNEDELNFVVQQTIDRIIFLRIAEDRSIEHYGNLQETLKQGIYFKNLLQLFHEADEKYNSGLFDFRKDTISKDLQISNKTLKNIINQLYYPESPYEFSVLSVEILGSAYEQFLGKTITINNRGKAVIELKPEVRKAGGVYYTPQYIVDYIVENTIGKLSEGKTPKEVAELKIVDPACGSGSFLLGAYQYLLNWHKDYYAKTPNRKNPITPDGSLNTNEKKRILLNNIFGVDIDTNAVEVTKLSLLLKCMEGETQASITQQLTMFNERVLPTLDDNIKCGNSLIDTDYYDNEMDFGEEKKIKPFNWQKSFPNVFKNGGFDVVIGNPPYVKEYTSRETFEHIKKSHISKYYQGKMDLWYFFACQGIDILKTNGLMGFIVPNNWVTNAGASILRNKIIKESTLINIVDFGSYMVFDSASIQTMILLTQKVKNKGYKFDYRKLEITKPTIFDAHNILNLDNKTEYKNFQPSVEPEKYENKFLIFNNNKLKSLLDKLKQRQNFSINEKKEIAQGIVPNPDIINNRNIGLVPKEKIIEFNIKVGDGVFILKKDFFNSISGEEKKYLKPTYEPYQVSEYGLMESDKEIIYVTKKNYNNDGKIIIEHLEKFKEIMNKRRENIQNKLSFIHLHWAREEYFFTKGPKILCIRKCNKPTFCYTENEAYVMMSFNVIKSDRINLKYLSGLFNSNLIAFWLRNNGKMQGNNYQIDKEPILEIPIFKTENQQANDEIIKSVEHLLQLNKDLQTATIETQKQHIKTKTDYHKDKINKLVYQLYDLTKEEIKIVEEW